MANSKHRAIGSYIAALMNASTALAGGFIFENRDYSLPTDRSAQLHVNVSASMPLDPGMAGISSPIDYETTIELTVLTRRADGVEASAAADAIWTDAYARVMADRTLGGLVWALDPGEMNSEPDEADTSLTRLTWLIKVSHRTDATSIST
jgi:hypothetical protein